MAEKIAVSKFVIDIGGEAKELTVKQIRELHTFLGGVLGSSTTGPVQVDRTFVEKKKRKHWSCGLRSDGIPENGMVVISHVAE